MSRGKKGRGGGGGFRGRGGGRARAGAGAGQDRRGGGRAEILRVNGKLEEYYNALGIVDENERDAFWAALRSDLPNSFRFAGSKGHALTVQRRLIDHYIPEITSVEYEGSPVSPPKPVEWFPDRLAWSMTTPKNVIRRFAPFASFQKFLVSENSVGNITRQEIVSMIPPLLMDIKSGMTVLDLCAAPGSKSAQLIEMLHGGEEARVRQVLEAAAKEEGRDTGPEAVEVRVERVEIFSGEEYLDDGRSTGLLIANDVEYRRSQMLVHQCKRLNSPNLIVTNHDATMFPSIRIPSDFGQRYLKFDRILADVPCSGDGTCRKNPEIWREWQPTKGLGLHLTQVRILVRALQMLKVGGRVVYSTCSMNPVENESVVASAVDRCGGIKKVKLLDQSEALPGLKRRSGLKTWKIMDKKGRWWKDWEEVERSRGEDGDESMARISESMFPPNASGNDAIPLENCLRIYPHLQDTGGFFIAVLEKQSEIKARPEKEAKKPTPPAPAPSNGFSIMSIVNEIEAQTDAESIGLDKIESLDKIMPSTVNHDDDMDNGNVPAAARQNKENAPTAEVSSRKRSLDAEADASASTKRPKFREEIDEVAEEGAEDRQVHWPPPPGANLELTEHHHDPKAENGASAGKKSTQPYEEAFKYLAPDHEELIDIYSFYNISPRFPRDRFMVRNATGQPVKAIYYTTTLARDILVQNEGKGLKFVHCGVKMFVKQDVQNQPGACKWRIQSEGLPIIEAWVGEERVVRLRTKETLRKLLVEMFPKVSGDSWKTLGDIGERIRDLPMGCCVLRAEPRPASEEGNGAAEDDGGFEERLVMPLWRGLGSLNLMLPKEERKAMLLRLFNDSSPLIDHSQDRRRAKEAAAQDASETLAERDDEAEGEPIVSISDDDDDEDGGVPLNAQAEAAGIEERAEQVEDEVMAEAQHLADTTRETAPGVVDEDESFNKTV